MMENPGINQNQTNMFKTLSVALLVIATGTASHAAWLPNSQNQYSVYYEYEPLCNENRRQVQVRLIDSTKFLVGTDVVAGAVLFGVRFKSVGLKNRVSTGVTYCEPYKPKQLTFWDGHRANSENDRKISLGYSQCLVDYNQDGIFDDSGSGYLKPPDTVSTSHQYRYETILENGPVDTSCARQTPVNATLLVNESVWTALTENERVKLRALSVVDVVPVGEVGAIVHSQKLDSSSPGSNSGAALGEKLAAANYIDKSISAGNYSAKNQLGAQVLGAVLGSSLDTNSRTRFVVRYTVKLASGELVSIDKSSNSNDFVLPNGMCVGIPKVEQTTQSICDATLSAFRATHFGISAQPSPQSNSKEARLKELKRLFEEGLLSESVYREQQSKVLDN